MALRPSRTVALLSVLLAAGCLGASPKDPAPTIPTEMTYDAVRFETDAGDFTVILYNKSAPQTVGLMRDFVAEGYYEGRGFYRIVPGHVIQVSDAAGGATDDTRRVPLETHADYQFSAGAVGIARGNDTDSGGPEFFVMDFATSHLHGNYTVWGQVVEGLAVVHRIARGPAIDFRTLPPELGPVEPTDRMALPPVHILETVPTRVTVPVGLYPMHVAGARVGDLRHAVEWPNVLEPGKAADFTWYVRGYNGTVAPDVTHVSLQVDGESVPLTGEPEFTGIYHFRWTPPDGNPHAATLRIDGGTPVTLAIRP